MAGTSWAQQASGVATAAQKQLDQAVKGSFAWTQAMIDVITAKAADGEKTARITMEEKAFLYSLYQAIGAGGIVGGMPEASLLIRTYVRVIPVLWGTPSPVDIGSEIYETSPGVNSEMQRQIAIADRHFSASPDSKEFEQRSGKMIAEQGNRRMFYADNRFIMTSKSQPVGGGFLTTFRVDNTYDFEPFQGGANWKNVSKWSKFPFKGNYLIIYDGLSQYLTVLGLAWEFDYYAEWSRFWQKGGLNPKPAKK